MCVYTDVCVCVSHACILSTERLHGRVEGINPLNHPLACAAAVAPPPTLPDGYIIKKPFAAVALDSEESEEETYAQDRELARKTKFGKQSEQEILVECQRLVDYPTTDWKEVLRTMQEQVCVQA